MTWGNSVEALEALYEQTGTLPPVLESKPELFPENVIYMEAFSTLSASRQNADNVINPITFSDVMLYCDCVGEHDPYERMRYWSIISAADREFISCMLDERKKQMDKVAKPK